MSDYTQNVNRYSYCLNNPLKFNDPSGEFIPLLVVAAAAAIGGGGGVNVAVHWKEIKAAGGGWNTFWKGPDIFWVGAVIALEALMLCSGGIAGALGG